MTESLKSSQGFLKLMSNKDLNRRGRKENQFIFAFFALLAVRWTKNQETRPGFEKALQKLIRGLTLITY